MKDWRAEEIVLSRGAVTRTLLLVAILLAAISLLLNVIACHMGLDRGDGWGLGRRDAVQGRDRLGERPELASLAISRRLFNVGQEGNIPTLYATLLLAFGALLAAATAHLSGETRPRHVFGWSGVALVLGYLCLDEAAGIHERWPHLQDRFFAEHLPPGSPWTVLGCVAAIAVVVAITPFLVRAPRDTGRRLMLAGAVYIIGALGVESIGTMLRLGSAGAIAIICAETVEETLEMLGAVLVIGALLRHISVHHHGLNVLIE